MITVKTKTTVDNQMAHEILQKFIEAGLQTEVTFVIEQSQPYLRKKLDDIIAKSPVVDQLQEQITNPNFRTDEELANEEAANANKVAKEGITIGKPGYMEEVKGSDGTIHWMAEDNSMVMLELTPNALAGFVPTQHDVQQFGCKLTNKYIYCPIENLKIGIRVSTK